MSLSGARFAVMTGDTAYPGGGQKEYGDLQQAGIDQSTVFGPNFWAVPGRSIPVFNVTGNHGFTTGSNQVVNWPEGNAAATSGGKYLMETYPSINGSTRPATRACGTPSTPGRRASTCSPPPGATEHRHRKRVPERQ